MPLWNWKKASRVWYTFPNSLGSSASPRPSDVLTQGDEIEAVVLGVNTEEQKISLGRTATRHQPMGMTSMGDTRLAARSRAKCVTSRHMAPSSRWRTALIGMIHVSDLSWTRKINHPSEILKKGEEIEAQVIEIDKQNQRVSLGVKQLESGSME